MLARAHRLTRTADFDRVFAASAPTNHALLALRAAANEQQNIRVGIICGKRVGGAVIRNRARRRLRAALHTLLPRLLGAWDILLVIRPSGAKATVAEFVYALEDLLRRRGILAEAREE